MSKAVSRLILLALALLALTEAACDEKPTKTHIYNPFPKQLSGPSADSTYAYFRDEGDAHGRPPGIYRVPLTGGGAPEVVIPGALAFEPTINPNGRHLAYMIYPTALGIRDLVTGEDSVISIGWVTGIDWFRGDTVVCDLIGYGLHLVNWRTGALTKIWGSDGRFPSADSSGKLAFLQFRPRNGAPDTTEMKIIRILDADSIASVQFVHEELDYARWSEDGRKLVLSRDRVGEPRVATLSWPELTVVDSLALYGADAAFTAAGQIIYVSLGDKSKGEVDDICIMNSDGSGKSCLLQLDNVSSRPRR